MGGCRNFRRQGRGYDVPPLSKPFKRALRKRNVGLEIAMTTFLATHDTEL